MPHFFWVAAAGSWMKQSSGEAYILRPPFQILLHNLLHLTAAGNFSGKWLYMSAFASRLDVI